MIKARLLLVTMLCISCSSKHANNINIDTPEQAITALKDGNSRFMSAQSISPTCHKARIAHTAPHQEPFVAVVGCSDSRVPTELIFDHGIGEIFVIRTAGNTVNSSTTMGSVDYAVMHLKVKAVVVLGHGSCGGIKGAISTDNQNQEHDQEQAEHSISNLLEDIRKGIPEYIGKPDQIDEAITANTKAQVERIKLAPHVAARIKSGELIVCAAYYDINTGKVEFLD